MAEKEIKKLGSVSVTIQREDRLRAITNLSEAVLRLAKSLDSVPCVCITNNHIVCDGGGTAIDIATEEDVPRTEIITVGEDDADGQD